MRLLFAECCNHLVVPDDDLHKLTWCPCGASCCWWDEPTAGRFAVFSIQGDEAVSIITISNKLFLVEYPADKERNVISRRIIRDLIGSSNPYHFYDSLILRTRPGALPDTRFATVEEVAAKRRPA